MSGPDPAAWGILHGHQAIGGRWVPAPPAGVAAALSAMHADSAGPPPTRTWVVRADEVVRLPAPAVLVTEDGGRQRVEGALPPVPLGYHRLEFDDGPVRLIVSPGQCPLPAGRGWGWSMQLYATRSSQSWGMGDLADLAVLGRWAASQGASLVLINPLHAVAPGAAQQASPYFPSSRRWRNPLYLRVEDVPGAAALGPALGVLAEAGQALNWSRLIDRSRVWELKHDALSRIWAARTGDDGRLARWVADAGSSLATFATHAALAEEHGSDWREWPAQFRRPGDPAVARFAGGPGADRVMFHGWLQWLLDAQLAAAAAALPIVADLAIGADPGGADAWEWQDVQAGGVTVGAPPDDFSPLGQDWGFPPFDPWRLRSAGYQPWIELVRAALSRAGGLRIDHVAGLFRQYWVPSGASPADGVYVCYPWADLCNIVALEAHRAGAVIVGEDLGTVEPEVRAALADANILSYRLLWFEDDPPQRWPVAALAAVTTHDLPTIAGAWVGADAEDRRAVGATIDDETDRRMLARLARAAGVVAGRDSVTGAVVGAYRALAASPCALAAVTLDDALEIVERPNLPGTLADRPNWSLALPMALDGLLEDPRLDRVAGLMRAARPRHA